MFKQPKRIKAHSRLSTWFMRHGQAFFASLGRFWRNPLANLTTIVVISIALALPAGLYIVLENIQALSHGWDDSAQISLFLKLNTSVEQTQTLVQQLKQNTDIKSVTYISPEQGIKQFETQAGFGDVLQQLHNNPLPGVIIVEPAVALNTPFAISQLLSRLQQLQQVDTAKLDLIWIKRLYSIINLAQRGVIALSILLALAVALIIGNTIRLSIQNQRREIEVTKLVGATNAFIRRPYLYIGAVYGFFGAAIAWVLVNMLIIGLTAPVENLTGLYQSSFYLQGFSLFATEILFIIGIVLGLVGAWVAVGRELKSIEPE